MRPLHLWLTALALWSSASSSGPALAAPPAVSRNVEATTRPAEPPSWDAGRIKADLEAGKPLVVHVRVALCSNDQVDCGSTLAGKAGDLSHNLYWGAIFGARRFLERKKSEFSRVSLQKIDKVVLERAIYRRKVPTARWKLQRSGEIEQLVILDAVHGDSIDSAVAGFWDTASHGSTLSFDESGTTRTVSVHVAGYVGHNRMMDGLNLADTAADEEAVPSFVLACYSESYFGKKLRRAGSEPLVTTRQLMAPEGYVLDAVLRAIGDGVDQRAIRRSAVRAYAKWQKLSPGVASSIFAPTPPR